MANRIANTTITLLGLGITGIAALRAAARWLNYQATHEPIPENNGGVRQRRIPPRHPMSRA